jgi:putative DNA primase/helicase
LCAEEIDALVENATVAEIVSAPLGAEEIDAPVVRASADPTVNDECGAAFARLAAMSRVDYDRVRKDEAEKLGVRVGTLDDEVAARRPKAKQEDEDEAGQGPATTFREIEPWLEPVYGAMLLDEIVGQISRYVMLPREAATTIALWIVHCHSFDLFPITPRLLIESPTRRCGKTRIVEILERLVPRALRADNISAAALFRVVDKSRPVVLIDEADSFLKDSEDHRNIVNSGHARGGVVVRVVGDGLRLFSTFAPIALASIGSLAATIMDRGIVVVMRRRLPNELVDRFRSDRADHLHELARKTAQWVADNEEALHDADPDMPEALHDRACDNWRPLLAIADLAGGHWPEMARAAAQTLSMQGSEQDDQSRGEMLLADIRRVFDDRQKKAGKDANRVSSTGLVADLVALVDRPWATWSKGKSITSKAVARLLKGFGVFPNTIKLSDGNQPNGYKRSWFDDAFARYLPHPPGSPVQSSPSSPTPANPGASGQFQGSPLGASGEVSEPAQSLEKQGVGEDGELSFPQTGSLDGSGDTKELIDDNFDQPV